MGRLNLKLPMDSGGRANFIAIAFMLAFCCTGCSSERVDNTEILFGLSVAPVTLDPRYATDAESSRLNRLIYQSLVVLDYSAMPTPKLASWQVETLFRYRFTLQGVPRFHNDQPLTMHDVKATYDSVLYDSQISPHRYSLSIIDSIEVVDERNLIFTLNQPNPLFPGLLTMGILPAQLIKQGHRFSHAPVGSGGFQFLSWTDPNKIELLRLRDRHRVLFLVVKDPTVRILKLLHGELDLIQGNISPELFVRFQDDSRLVTDQALGNVFTYIGFNLEDSVTADLNVRRAVAHAIDRDSMVRYLFHDIVEKAETLLPFNHWAANRDLIGLEYNPTLAKDYMQRAGYGPNRLLEISYKTSSDPFRLRFATILQYQLKQIGIQLNVQSYDWGTFYGDIKQGRFQMYSLSWVGLKMPDIYRYVFHSSATPPVGANRGRWQDETTDRLIEQAESEYSLDRQAFYYRQLQAVLHEQLPYIPLWYEGRSLLHRTIIKGYTLHPEGYYDDLLEVEKINLPEDV